MSKQRDDFQNPDVVTASADYHNRFKGEIGQYLLDVQKGVIFKLLSKVTIAPCRILELGGAHGQLTKYLLDAGHHVVVQCSKTEGFERLNPLRTQYPDSLELIESPTGELPFDDQEFDVVIMVRLLSHLEYWDAVLKEAARVTKSYILFDYPTVLSFNFLSPFLFNLKKRIEGNTRRYTVFTERRMRRELAAADFKVVGVKKQFFIPMALHRLGKSPKASKFCERIALASGLTRYLGSPAIMLGSRKPESLRTANT